LLHVAGRITRSGRQTAMHLQTDWPLIRPGFDGGS
jgi:hypothetical protein